MKDIRNIAIVAHVDAGKTSLTEHFLFKSSSIKSLGSVDKGTSQTDFLKIERDRGISVLAATMTFEWNDITINLIDTPGHADFAGEVERALKAVDGVVLVVSAAEGVQPQTVAYWKILSKMNIPVIVFVNKIDRSGVDVEEVVEQIQKELSADVVPIQYVVDEGADDTSVVEFLKCNSRRDDFVEQLATYDEELFDKFCSDISLSDSEISSVLAELTRSTELYPLMFGSSKNDVGVDELMIAVRDLLPSPKCVSGDAVSAIVYKIVHDKMLGRVAFVRVFDGRLKVKEILQNITLGSESKINQLKKISGNRLIDIKEASAGEIVAVCGLTDARVGDVLGCGDHVPKQYDVNPPLLDVKVVPVDSAKVAELAEALNILFIEDPRLDFNWDKDENELTIKIMGHIQTEVLASILKERFAVEAEFKDSTIIYKETIATDAIGAERYTMPKPCWAVVKFRIEPGDTGSGVVYESKVSVNDIHNKYQNEVSRTIPKALAQGVKGWEVTDVKITLIEGEDHVMHSNPGDFIVATPMAIMNGLNSAGTVLLEPIIGFTITGEDELLGKITADITRMRGSFETPSFDGSTFTLKGKFPLSTSMDYPVKLNSHYGGQARIITDFSGYEKVNDEHGTVRDFRGISPLDRSKYILKARKAIQ